MRFDFFKVLSSTGFPVEKAMTQFNACQINGEWQSRQAWEIFNFHYANNPFYRDLVKNKPERWEDLPVLTRDHLRGDFVSKLPLGSNPAKLYCSSTSGSSGDPLLFARDKLSHTMVWLNVEKQYNSVGLSLNDRQARMFGISRMPVARVKARIKDYLSNRYRFNIFDLSEEALDKWVKKFSDGKFKYIYGYSNTLVAFARHLETRGLVLSTIAPSLKGCVVTSEVCTDNDALAIAKALGITVYNEYGSSELGIIGFKTDTSWLCSTNLLKIEVLDQNHQPLPEGETGYLTCTALFNKATPFIRYRIGDLASIKTINGQTHITHLMGSLNDMAILPSGKKVPGISVYFIAEPLLKKVPRLQEFLVRQVGSKFKFEYVAPETLTGKEFSMLQKSFETMLEKGIDLEAIKVDKLQRGSNGKFKHFIHE